MPLLTLPIDPSHGPLVPAWVTACREQLPVFERLGLPVPEPIRVRLLLDTGASGTLVDERIVKAIGLPPVGESGSFSPLGGEIVTRSDYALCLAFGEVWRPTWAFGSELTAARLSADGFDGVLGRDILDVMLVTYNGPAKTFTLSW